MSAKNKGAKGAKTKQRAEKAKPVASTKLIPELAAMKFPAKVVAKLEALAEADQDTVLNYLNSGMKINDAYSMTHSENQRNSVAWARSALPAIVFEPYRTSALDLGEPYPSSWAYSMT
jgi:hypothetical protein